MKNWLKENKRLIAGAISQICAMGMAFVLAFLGYSMNVVNRQGSYYRTENTIPIRKSIYLPMTTGKELSSRRWSCQNSFTKQGI